MLDGALCAQLAGPDHCSVERLDDGADTIRQTLSDSPALSEELNSIVQSSRPSLQFLQMQEEHRKRQERQARSRADEKAAWAQLRRELGEQPALALAPGRSSNTIWNLWLVLRRLDSNGHEGRWDRAFLTAHFGLDVTDRLRRALMAYWRGMRPTVRCERRLGEENTYLVVWSIGLMGIYAEAEDPTWATKLSIAEAELAARYALLELNGLPSWLGGLAKAHRNQVEIVLGAEVVDELKDSGGDSGWHSMVLQSLRNSSQDVADVLLPQLMG